MSVCRGDGHAVHTAVDERTDMSDNPVAVDAAILVTDRGNGRTAEKSECRVAGRLQGRTGFLGNTLDVAESEQPLESILIVHHQQLVNAQVLGEEAVGAGDGI